MNSTNLSPQAWIVDNIKSLINSSKLDDENNDDDDLFDCTLTLDIEKSRGNYDHEPFPNQSSTSFLNHLHKRPFSPEEIKLNNYTDEFNFIPIQNYSFKQTNTHNNNNKLSTSNSSSSISSLMQQLDDSQLNLKKKKLNQSISGSSLLKPNSFNLPNLTFANDQSNTSDYIDYDPSISFNQNQFLDSYHDMSNNQLNTNNDYNIQSYHNQFLSVPNGFNSQQHQQQQQQQQNKNLLKPNHHLNKLSTSTSTPSNQYKFLNKKNHNDFIDFYQTNQANLPQYQFYDQENYYIKQSNSNNSISSLDSATSFTVNSNSNRKTLHRTNSTSCHKYQQQIKIPKSSSTLFNPQQQQNHFNVSHSTSFDNIGKYQQFNLENSFNTSFLSHQQKWSSNNSQVQMTPKEQINLSTNNNDNHITLHVKNLDYKISSDEWKRILLENFRKHCKDIISVNVVTNTDKSLLGIVKLGSKEDARLAISSLHHKKIGYKRLNVNIAFSPNTSSPKSKIVALLKSAASSDTNEMLLTRFIELYEQRYNQTITISELYKLKDIIYITHSRDGQGRLIKLSCKNYQNNLENEMQELLHQPYCSLHSSLNSKQQLHDNKDVSYLPNVIVSLRTFKSAVHKLLNDHGGQMPLLSFMDCYKCCILNQNEFINTSNQLVIDHENGVSLEHLITCAQDVQIQYNEGFYKQLKWENDKSKQNAMHTKAKSELMNESDYYDQAPDQDETQRMLSQFSHEVVEMFKSVPKCCIPFSKFNNEFHKKYGRQCRVADYGYTKLYELLESIPHIVQILDGEFEKKLTLTHRVQVRRFSNDLLKALKTHKQMFADEFPQVYEKHFNKQFDIRDYGVCYLEDMLAELPESILSRKEIDGRTFIQIPKVVQDDDEVMCTQKLKYDIIDMLKLRPRFSIQFNKFIPNFHHHFGRQCKLSNYGFTKLIELLEAIPSTVQIVVKDSVQFVQLKQELMLDLICQNLVKLIEENNLRLKLNWTKLEELYNSKFEMIYYQDFECYTFNDLLNKLPYDRNFIKFERYESDLSLMVDQLNERDLKRVSKLILKKLIDDLEEVLVKKFTNNKTILFVDLFDYLSSVNQEFSQLINVKISNKRSLNYVLKQLIDFFIINNMNGFNDRFDMNMSMLSVSGLSDFYFFAKQVKALFKLNNCLDMSFNELDNVYKQMSQTNRSSGLPFKHYGYIDSNLLISHGLSLIVTVKKYQNDKRVCLNREFWPKSFLDSVPSSSSSLSDSFGSPISPLNSSARHLNGSNIISPRRIMSDSSSTYQI